MLFALITADDVQVLQAMLPSHSLGSAVVDPFSKRNKPPRSNAQTKLEAIISDIWSLVNRNPHLYHEAAVDYTDADTHTQLTNVILKGMPSALMIELDKPSKDMEKIANKAASKTDNELTAHPGDRGSYFVCARPKPT